MVLFGAVAVVMAPSCTTSTGSASQFEVKTTSAQGVDFHALKYWSWKPATRRGAEPGEGSPMKMQDDKTRAILESELNARGYPRAEGRRADFYVSFRLSSFHTARSEANAALATSGSNEPGPVGSQMSRSGSLTISFWLADHEEPIWTGSAGGTGAGFLRTDEQLRMGVRAVLAEFPPL